MFSNCLFIFQHFLKKQHPLVQFFSFSLLFSYNWLFTAIKKYFLTILLLLLTTASPATKLFILYKYCWPRLRLGIFMMVHSARKKDTKLFIFFRLLEANGKYNYPIINTVSPANKFFLLYKYYWPGLRFEIFMIVHSAGKGNYLAFFYGSWKLVVKVTYCSCC